MKANKQMALIIAGAILCAFGACSVINKESPPINNSNNNSASVENGGQSEQNSSGEENKIYEPLGRPEHIISQEDSQQTINNEQTQIQTPDNSTNSNQSDNQTPSQGQNQYGGQSQNQGAESESPDDNNEGYVAPPPSGQGHFASGTVASSDDPDLMNIWDTIFPIVSRAQYYYTDNFNKIRLISRNGYLYNRTSGSPVDVKYLCDNAGLNVKFMDKSCEVLLVKGSDVESYLNITLPAIDKGLTVFVAVRYGDSNYIITSANSGGHIVSAAAYKSLLAVYSQNHGSIRRLYNTADEYMRIINFIKVYESNFSKYYVRSVTTDDKYAFVVLSPQSSTADVKQYILSKEGKFWEVVMDNIQNEPRAIIAINKELPDFNTDMLPKYSLHDFKNSMKTNFNDIYELLMDGRYISSATDIYYMAGAGNYSYVVTTSNTKYLFTRDNDSWDITEVENSFEAENIMLGSSQNAPVFILLDD